MKKTTGFLLLWAILACGIMALTDGVWQPGYFLKSAVKVGVFLAVPLALGRGFREVRSLDFFHFPGKKILPLLGLGIALYGLILGSYFLVSRWIDFSNVAGALAGNAGVNRGNFLWISLYISFVNSLLEEFFFRGFLFENISADLGRRWGYGISAGLFSLYHGAMMIGWFSPWLVVGLLAALAVGGVILNWLEARNNTVFAPWLVHMFANFAINTIGFILM